MDIDEVIVEQKVVEDWLRLIGSTPNEVKDDKTEWHLEFDYPMKSQERMHVVCPSSHQIVIVNKFIVSPKHIKTFDELPANEQREFSLSLRHELTRPEVDFQLEDSNGLLKCPTSIQLSRVRFGDGLTLDSFYESIGFVFKAKTSAILYINMSLEEPDTTGNKFGFKTIPN